MSLFGEKLKAAVATTTKNKKLEQLPISGKKVAFKKEVLASSNFDKSSNNTYSINSKNNTATKPTTGASKKTDNFKAIEVVIQPDAQIFFNNEINSSYELLDLHLELGCKTSIHISSDVERRELSLGLDFGTSSAKVVIGDHGSDQSYAVPFLKAIGINAYLLPSRVFLNSQTSSAKPFDQFDLTKSPTAFRDLKLGLLGNPFDSERQIQVIAFLAQVIHRSRSWFFSTHSSIYKKINCLWRLRIGLPASTALNNKFVPIYSKIAHASWLLAELTAKPTLQQTQQIRDLVFNQNKLAEELEVEIIPEIAAQIYGFVVSTSFDKKAPNRFLMVDVGAGTVDASLFKVIPAKGGKWNFEFYTAVIQPYGVANLHSARIDWWLKNLPDTSPGIELKLEMKKSKYITDLGSHIPDYCEDYVNGVGFKAIKPSDCDSVFFDKKIASQVQGSTIWSAFKDGYLSKDQLKNVPMFLCGGGARSKFYSDLKKLVQHPPGYSWLSVQPLQLALPNDLIGEGINSEDFDRLSVAYGLSRLEVGRIVKANPQPRVIEAAISPFADRFVDKDQC